MRLRRKINIALTHARNVRVLIQHLGSRIKHRFLFGASEATIFKPRIAAELSHSNLLAGFRGAARPGPSTIGGTIFPQLSELAAGAISLCRLLTQLGIVVLRFFLFPILFCCLRRAI